MLLAKQLRFQQKVQISLNNISSSDQKLQINLNNPILTNRAVNNHRLIISSPKRPLQIQLKSSLSKFPQKKKTSKTFQKLFFVEFTNSSQFYEAVRGQPLSSIRSQLSIKPSSQTKRHMYTPNLHHPVNILRSPKTILFTTVPKTSNNLRHTKFLSNSISIKF
jgi:hypothetical protein